jgi:CheY-like chemotaxis protein
MQLNLQALTTDLPRLIGVYREHAGDSKHQPPINPDHLAALSRLPLTLENDIQRLRELTQTFLAQIARPGSSGMESSQPTQGRALLNIQRVLLIEDEEIHQQITVKQLGGKYPIDIAGNGAEALRLCAVHAYDLVLLDFVLPGMDGRSLVAVLRQLLPHNAAIVALSNMPIQPEEYRVLDIQGCLAKPFRLQNLEQFVADLANAGGTTERSQP